ncbi:MAG: 2-amino-4-hydroxy-6-hydroxymethyldihydropteridine diphosphokinase [Candidatus Adiutrix sp.]|jgi:2-amino-4-hydroxy-6-hydroxymethyldihydropteridine diphosphokinase|nr:2-amino-4-hydroxy-6-hydroxymethyldihydropteridine diphosphokinase [Candidatus Adiutrix sp.]
MTPAADLEKAALVGLGANMEKPSGMIREAVRRLNGASGLRLLAVSSVYLTEPQGGPAGQNWFHNAVAFFDSRLSPAELMKLLLSTEAEMGRRRLVPNGPRVIDLDFLAQGILVLDEPPHLILPHPRMERRSFVLAPLAELAPGWRHPVSGRTASELLAALPPEGQGFKKLKEL